MLCGQHLDRASHTYACIPAPQAVKGNEARVYDDQYFVARRERPSPQRLRHSNPPTACSIHITVWVELQRFPAKPDDISLQGWARAWHRRRHSCGGWRDVLAAWSPAPANAGGKDETSGRHTCQRPDTVQFQGPPVPSSQRRSHNIGSGLTRRWDLAYLEATMKAEIISTAECHSERREESFIAMPNTCRSERPFAEFILSTVEGLRVTGG